ncbi:GntR family transcriptional regulator [Nocardioides sp. NPDC127503]|uniref:GntR family transcriptional regulator n=1 Tax=Nocardioides sp. NPDC127503 TaxID=3154516 RepID=UPI0033306E84
MGKPLYVQIRRDLEAQIRSGALPTGAKLPTEKELGESYGVSRHTAQRVLNDLAGAGLAVRRRRQGTIVSDVRRQVDLLSFASPESAKSGLPGRHEVISARIARAGDAVLELPGASPDTAVVELVRRKFDARDEPSSIERHVVLFAVAPDLLERDLEHLVSLNYFREKKVAVDAVRIYLDPVALSQTEATLLESAEGAPTLQRRRELMQEDRTVIEVVTVLVRPGSAEFFLEVPFSQA